MVSLSNPFNARMGEVHQGVSILNVVIYYYKVLAIFIDADTMIKGVQIGDHEMKILIFPHDTTIFLLTDIN